MHFDQHVHGEVEGERRELVHRARFERGRDEQHAVAPERARLVDLPGVDDELLAQHRQPAGVLRERDVLVAPRKKSRSVSTESAEAPPCS